MRAGRPARSFDSAAAAPRGCPPIDFRAMSDRTATPAELEAHLDAHRDERLEQPQGIPAHPEHLGAARARAPTSGARPSGSPRSSARPASRTSRSARPAAIPIVYGDWLHAEGAPTVIVYGHYDVQPVDPLDEWTHARRSSRWSMAIGSSAGASADDKGQIHAHVVAAATLLATRGRLPDQRQVRLRGRGGELEHPPRCMADRQP